MSAYPRRRRSGCRPPVTPTGPTSPRPPTPTGAGRSRTALDRAGPGRTHPGRGGPRAAGPRRRPSRNRSPLRRRRDRPRPSRRRPAGRRRQPRRARPPAPPAASLAGGSHQQRLALGDGVALLVAAAAGGGQHERADEGDEVSTMGSGHALSLAVARSTAKVRRGASRRSSVGPTDSVTYGLSGTSRSSIGRSNR